ncbi:helix-turn-helix transcriptional regulator [Methanoregula sp.]|uniref:helix-turn-helix transcriptional regulator n=1 Tax=Methanoregula sp. TaxID=2052170 RepID=UPI00236F0115|nr:helix-turn-helix transcriptional regulator [Methanoregula sp.]MDD1687270.1 helix-turn-helix transcriptional regulator [Methanoregula sp.]
MKNKIKVYRAMRNMTQEELALQLRVTRRTINSIEGGKYNPSIEVAFRMAKLFAVPVEELFSLDEDE